MCDIWAADDSLACKRRASLLRVAVTGGSTTATAEVTSAAAAPPSAGLIGLTGAAVSSGPGVGATVRRKPVWRPIGTWCGDDLRRLRGAGAAEFDPLDATELAREVTAGGLGAIARGEAAVRAADLLAAASCWFASHLRRRAAITSA